MKIYSKDFFFPPILSFYLIELSIKKTILSLKKFLKCSLEHPTIANGEINRII